MLTVFLDANVLFSAAYKPGSRLLALWDLPKVTLASSAYAVEEARRNLPRSDQKAILETLVKDLRILLAVRPGSCLPPSVQLPDKDFPILAAAIQIEADIFLTGDFRHFGSLFGRRVKGVRILTPADFFASHLPAKQKK